MSTTDTTSGERAASHRRRLSWQSGSWTTSPAAFKLVGDALEVTAVEGSDAWRVTSYGFVHDDAHALIAPLETDQAVEVTFEAAFEQQFDQAGVFLRVDDEVWVKAGVEYVDGELQLGAVVTHHYSDWSSGPVPEWQGKTLTVRVSRSGDAVTIRARAEDGPYRLVRVAWLDPEARVDAGPFLCAPSRAGLTVRFLSWTVSDADAALH
ncbi:DUF1349 domain-containing protein [Arthrobacter sp. 2MCAF14]|uniref:DUF1349 domain-containing protein n=1 Tax=Arthrobacter sp. 2MCAF14 TaxID=3232982 RepID=UPI003F932795